jgi:hypothetical protein
MNYGRICARLSDDGCQRPPTASLQIADERLDSAEQLCSFLCCLVIGLTQIANFNQNYYKTKELA